MNIIKIIGNADKNKLNKIYLISLIFKIFSHQFDSKCKYTVHSTYTSIKKILV